MTTPANNPRAAFLRMLIPLLLGIGIGISIGMNLGNKDATPDEIKTAQTDTLPTPTDDGPDGPPRDEAPPEVDTVPPAMPVGDELPSDAVSMDTDDDADASESDLMPDVTPAEPAEIPGPGEEWPGRHLFIAVSGTELDDATRTLLREVLPGGIVLTSENITDAEQAGTLIASIKAAATMGTTPSSLPLIAVDLDQTPPSAFGIEGVPTVSDIGAAVSTSLARDTGENIGDALHDLGVSILLGPPLDVYAADSGNAVFANRTFGADNALVTALGLSMADGLMRSGVIPVIKHYPGHGATAQDSRQALAVLELDIPGLAATMFPFSESADHGIPGILVGHIAVPRIDLDAPTTPASLSHRMIEKILREKWGYDGVIVADDMALPAIADSHTEEEATIAALAAGADAVILVDPKPERIRAVCSAIELAVENGDLDGTSLERSRERLETWQTWLENPGGLKGPLPDVPERFKAIAKAVPAPVITATPDVPATSPAPPDGEPVMHTIAKGETLNAIGRKYNVTPADIMAWNNLTDGNIKYGYKLKIYPDGAPAPEEAEPTEESAATPEPVEATSPDVESIEQPEAVATPEPEATEPPVETADAAPETTKSMETEEPVEPEATVAAEPIPTPQPEGTKEIIHEVVPGDMLSRLSVRYGVRLSDVVAWNALTDTTIKVGQKLVFYVPEAFEPAPDIVPAPAPEEKAPEAAPTSPEATESAPPAAETSEPDGAATEPGEGTPPDGAADAPQSE